MKLKNTLLIFTAVLLLIMACDKNEIPLFNREETGVYFLYMSGSATRPYDDSLNFSFAGGAVDRDAAMVEYTAYTQYGTPMTPIDNFTVNITEYVFSIPVQAMGKVKNYPRPVKVLIDEERTTATLGLHYEVDLDNVVIPAGESSARLNVKVFRTPDMLEREFTIAFALEENDHFQLYLQTQRSMNVYTRPGEEIKATRFIIAVSEIYTEPSYWMSFCRTNYFGTWSVRKYIFVNESLGWSHAEWLLAGFPISGVALGRFGYASSLVQNKLQRLADTGTPMREADGSLMQLAGIYLVDYSAYE
jgi:hypothetical protein